MFAGVRNHAIRDIMRIVPNPGRWLVAGAATVVMLTIGAIYSWAIFTQPLLVAYHWDLTTTTWAYAIANFSLAAVGATIGGFWQDRVGPRTVAMVGVALWGAATCSPVSEHRCSGRLGCT